MPKLDPNQVQLSDGRVVTMRETDGGDEIAVSMMLGSHFTQDGAGIQLYTKGIVLRSITDIGGQPAYKSPLKFKDFMEFWRGLKTRDSQALMKKYAQVNGDSEDPLDEGSESETQESDI